ncbi:mitochondrial metal transporter [Collariella sp. IMI 366227]|nr:mitochondrial metal transporter [Collariella sp. IMI 366227]
MGTATQSRGHAGHGHGHHHHHHDNVYLTSQNKNDAGVRITRIGLYSNLGMAIAKGAGGYAFNSQSMIADAWHSLTDLASDVLTLATVSWSLKPPTENFPQGFGKVESLGSLGVSSMLLFGAMKVAVARKSSVLASNAVHHRVDSLTGIVALLAILGANLLRDATWLDPVGGLLISLLVIRAGLSNTLSALYELADRSIDDEVRTSIQKQVRKSLAEEVADGAGEMVELREVTGVKSGQNYLVEGGFDEFIKGDVSARSSLEVEEKEGNGYGHEHGKEHDKHRKDE